MDAATQQAADGQPQAEAQKLSIDKFADGQIVCLKFSGTVDEDFDGKKLSSTVKAETLVLDLADIRKISSFGIREWVDFINAIQKNCENIILLECAPKVVDQLNMVANFAGEGRVFSFYAPYRCDYCDSDSTVLMQVDKDWEIIKSMKPPERPCGACGEPEYFDEDPTTYFSFIAGQDKFEIEPEVGAFLSSKLNYTVSESAQKLRIDKIIEDRSTYLKLSGNLDGSFPREKLAEGMEGTIIMDVTGMGKIDPAGAAEWRGFLQMITPTAEALYLLGVPPGFLEKLTKPEDLGPKAQVVTFAMPYSCAKCATTASQLIDVEQHYDVLKFATPPEMKCSDCKSPTVCAATEGLLSHLPTLPKPSISPQTRKFIKEVKERKPEKKKVATTVAEAAAAGKGAGTGTMIAIAAITASLVVGGLVLYRYIQERDAQAKRAAAERRDAVGSLIQSAVEGEERPNWVPWERGSEKRFDAECNWIDDELSCIGVSSYASSEADATEEAKEAALEGIVNAVGLKITDDSFQTNVWSLFGEQRTNAHQRYQKYKKDPDEQKYEAARIALREGRKAVNKALVKTGGGAVPTAPTNEFWEEYEASSGEGSSFLVFVEYRVGADHVQRLIDTYSKTCETKGAKVATVYPGVAWRYPDIEAGAIIVGLDSSDLKGLGLSEQQVMLEVQNRNIDSGQALCKIFEDEWTDLKEKGGNLDMLVKTGDNPPRKYSTLIEKTVKKTKPTNTGGTRRPPRNTGSSGTINTWDRVGGGSGSRDDPTQ